MTLDRGSQLESAEDAERKRKILEWLARTLRAPPNTERD